jgi:hypothetical protein
MFAVGWAGYAAVAWQHYGKVSPRHRPDEHLDRFMPAYEVAEVHQARVRAPAAVTYEAAMTLSFDRSPLVRAIFRGRELLMGAQASPRRPRPFLEEIRNVGWGVLADVPGRQMVFGAVTRPWEPNVQFRAIDPEHFARFEEPGYAKIAWTLLVEPHGAGESVFRTETRVATTDLDSRARFRRYWSIFSPGILLIRYEMLRLVRAEAERRVRFLPAGSPSRRMVTTP